jgi:hypothetical protein
MLDAMERLLGNLAHHPEREGDDGLERELPGEDGREAERDQRREGDDRGVPDCCVAGRAAGDSVDDLPGIERGQDVGEGGNEEPAEDQPDAERLFAPMPEGKAQDFCKGLPADTDFGSRHDVDPAARERVRSRSECE